ncbi:hypothetical protein Pla175_28950 [Pirellulimonas nuda]|uniref:Transposase n=1 Tax=Pirellulimonas nuda TaxID=2528009 RepID=A0A518DDH2_9BACT|nr:transposase [Pirellulimonas nuda]QDU89503.1 hypothetical protein Pla175_28950 [Pirellulimonas nuda]
MAKQQRSAEKESFWRLAFEEFGSSGLSVRAFCEREGISTASFYAWRRSLQQLDSEPARVELIPVDVVEPPGGLSADRLELTTPGGFTLRFPADIAPRQLGAVLGVIEGGAPC